MINDSFIQLLLDKAKADNVQKLATGAFIKKNGKLLILRRALSDEFLPGYHDLPGGGVEPEESLLDGLKREVFEETFLRIEEVVDYVNAFDYISSNGLRTRQFNFMVRTAGFDVKVNPDEHSEYAWIAANGFTLRNMEFSDKLRACFEDAFRNSVLAYGQNILLLVPHPDDEVVACATAIARAKATGANIYALYLTTGCIDRDSRWSWDKKNHERYVLRRRNEAERAANFLGITPLFWSDVPARHLWQHLREAKKTVSQAVAAYQIDQIWAPAFEGGNADHDGANALAQCFSPDILVEEFAEYNYANRRAHSHEFPDPNGSEHRIVLTHEEQQRKKVALRIYHSEKGNLGYVKTECEVFRPLGAHDYSRPPHLGTLWYARFQWVPFKHPRVDFTNPADVYDTLAHFVAHNKQP